MDTDCGLSAGDDYYKFEILDESIQMTNENFTMRNSTLWSNPIPMGIKTTRKFILFRFDFDKSILS